MINCKNASRRLKSTSNQLDAIFTKLGIDENMPKENLTRSEKQKVVRYLNTFIVEFSIMKYDELDARYSTMREMVLALTCLSGDVKNLEPIVIIMKIVKNEQVIQETSEAIKAQRTS